MNDRIITYKLKRSKRARLMRISVSCDAGVVVTVPLGMEESRFEKFIKEKTHWILSKLKFFEKNKNRTYLASSALEYRKLKFQAYALAKERLEFWNKYYGFAYNRISIKNQKTRWGSCSKKGNLNFHYKIVHLPKDQLDYLIVHELCHLKELNHSKGFWGLVGRTIPDYKFLRKQLRNIVIK